MWSRGRCARRSRGRWVIRTLEVGLWLPDRDAWVDEQGEPLHLPPGEGRHATYIGDRLAVVVHELDLVDQPALVEAAGSAARLALENARLHAELRAQLVELRASRARIVEGDDIERRRLRARPPRRRPAAARGCSRCSCG